MMTKSCWYVWTINPQKYKKILRFLEYLSEIEEILYPIVYQEYNTKSGIKTREVPLYSNYLFIKYKYSIELLSKLDNCTWISSYIGKCPIDEINRIKKINRLRYEDVVPDNIVEVGKSVELINTAFSGMKAVLVGISGDTLFVSIKIFGDDRIIKCSINDVKM